MREMKDSGIEWVGDIPKNWSVNKIKYITLSRTAKYKLSDVEKYIGLENVESASGHYVETNSEYEDGYYDGCEQGDLLYGKLRPNLAKVLLSPFKACCTGEFEVISRTDIGKKYLQYYMLTDGFTQTVTASTYGAKMPRANWDFIKNIGIVYPCVAEREKIVAFLDSECAEIDALSADIQSEIDTLEAYKRSVITETVTKGLNPNAHMKDSGTGWMGDVPESWNKTRVKYCLKEVNERSIAGEEEPLSMSQKMGLVPTTMINVPHIMATYVGAKIARPNDLVLNKLKAHLGVFSVSQYTGLVSPDYAVYQAYDNTNPKYLEYLFKTDACINEFKKYITGVGQGLSRLYTKDLFRIAIAIPSCDEQDCIVDYLNRKSAEIDAIVKQKQEQLALLADYKKSLIYEYVTGKKEIPDKDI